MADEVHLTRSVRPDHTAPPNEPIVYYSASGGDVAEHPDVEAGNGMLHMVWNDNTGATAIRYSVCDFSSTVDCTDASDWLSTPEHVRESGSDTYLDAKFAQMAVDGERQIVVFQYNAGTSINPQIRVAAAERCEGDTYWTIEHIRTPTTATDDQTIVFGRPALVLNRQEHIAHVVLIEADDYANGYNVGSMTESALYWYRKGYSGCP